VCWQIAVAATDPGVGPPEARCNAVSALACRALAMVDAPAAGEPRAYDGVRAAGATDARTETTGLRLGRNTTHQKTHTKRQRRLLGTSRATAKASVPVHVA
jgi:hypothetical protein